MHTAASHKRKLAIRVNTRARRVVKSVLCLAVATCVGLQVSAQWTTIRLVETPRLGWLAIASMSCIMAFLAQALGLKVLLSSNGIRASLATSVGLFFVPALGKYVPGKMWAIPAGIYLYRRAGVPSDIALICMSLMMILGFVCATLVGVCLAASGIVAVSPVYVLVSVLSVAIACSPPVLYPAINAVLTRCGRKSIGNPPSLSTYLSVNAILAVGFLLYGAAFVCVVCSVTELSGSHVPQVAGLALLAQIGGILAFFAPAGIGVREGILIAGLRPLIGPGPAIVVTGVARLWQTALELIMAAIGWWILRRAGKPSVADRYGSQLSGAATSRDDFPCQAAESACE